MEADSVAHRPLHRHGAGAVQTFPVPGYGALLPPMCLIELDGAPFQVSDFAAHAMAYPAQIGNSVVRRQKEFFYGRMAARRALALLGEPTVDVPIGVMREPVWPAGIMGSISHNNVYAAALAARRARFSSVGIDIESVATPENQEAMQALVVSAGELAYLQRFPGALSVATMLTIVFSAKESLYKAAFAEVGRFFDFCDAHVTELDLERRTLVLTLQTDLSAQFTRGRQCRLHFAPIGQHSVITAFAC